MTSNPDDIRLEEFTKESDRILDLLTDYLQLNTCEPPAAVHAMVGIIMNEFLLQKLPWSTVEHYFKNVLDQAKPFFEEKR